MPRVRTIVLAGSLLVLSGTGLARAGGGGPSVVVGIGANHEAIQVILPRSIGELLYRGKPTVDPRRGYIRIYPIFYGLPGTPARLFPATGALCFDPPPKTRCRTLPSGAQNALARFHQLPIRTVVPTTISALFHGDKRLLLPNFATAIELALDGRSRPTSAPSAATGLKLRWHGPLQAVQPTEVSIGAAGVYSRGRTYPLSRSVIEYLRANLK